jgi:hypothetical protein
VSNDGEDRHLGFEAANRCLCAQEQSAAVADGATYLEVGSNCLANLDRQGQNMNVTAFAAHMQGSCLPIDII